MGKIVDDALMKELLAVAAAYILAEAIKGATPAYRVSEDLKHILVFGSAGVGKTSLINALTGESLPTNGGTRGVTLRSHEVLAHHDGVDYRLIDTAGLDEADGGSVSGDDAVKGLVRLLKRSKQGLNLMVMVVPSGRILASTLHNYELFIDKMVGKSVPLLIVVTHCEREPGDMQGWVDTNQRDFVARGILSNRMVATTFMTPDPELDNVERVQAKVNASIALSWGAIQSCATELPVDFLKENGGVPSVLRAMYNSIARLFGDKAIWVDVSVVKNIQKMTSLKYDVACQFVQQVEFFDG